MIYSAYRYLFVILLISCGDVLEDIKPEKETITYDTLEGKWDLKESYLIDSVGNEIEYNSTMIRSFLRFSHNTVARSGFFGSHAALYYINGNKIVTVIEGTRLIDVIYWIEEIQDNRMIIRMSTHYYLDNVNDKYKYMLMVVEKDER